MINYLHQVPAMVTIVNNSNKGVGVQFYRISSVITINAGDSIIIKASTSDELAYYLSLASEEIKVSFLADLDVNVIPSEYVSENPKYAIANTGKMIIESLVITVGGDIVSASAAAIADKGSLGDTHLICFKMTNKEITDWSAVKVNGVVISAEEQAGKFIYGFIGMKAADTTIADPFAIKWDGTNTTTYTFAMGTDLHLV